MYSLYSLKNKKITNHDNNTSFLVEELAVGFNVYLQINDKKKKFYLKDSLITLTEIQSNKDWIFFIEEKHDIFPKIKEICVVFDLISNIEKEKKFFFFLNKCTIETTLSIIDENKKELTSII